MSLELNRKLVGGFYRKEEEARAKIFDMYYPEMLGYAIRISEDMAYAPGFVTDAFLKLLDHPERFETMQKIRSYWYLVTKNLAIDHSKAHEKMKMEPVNVEELPDKSGGETDENIAGSVFDRLVYESVEALPRKNKAAFILHYYEKKSDAEISVLLGISEKTVGNQIRLARERLSKAIEPKKNLLYNLLISLFL
jgi:RNA polymerase sigma-70 factor, ECF subfamily